MRQARVWAVVAIALAGCDARRSAEGENTSTRQPGTETPPEILRCIAALETSANGAANKAARLAEGCAPACSGLADFSKAMATRPLDEATLWTALRTCELSCSAETEQLAASKDVSDRLLTLAESCGHETFSLPKAARYRYYASDTIVVASRVKRWLEQRAADVAPSEVGRLSKALEALHLLVPPPGSVIAQYDLPKASAVIPFSSPIYVVVGREGTRTAATPIVRLLGRDLELRPVQGGQPPGRPLFEGKERASMDGLVASWAHLHGGDAGSATFAYLVERSVGVERLLKIARTLGHQRFRLGIAGLSTREHQVEVIVPASPLAADVVLEDGELHIPGATEADLMARLRTASATPDGPRPVRLACAPSTSIAEFVRAMDAIAAAGADRVAILTARR